MFRNYGEGQDGTVDGGKMGIKLGVSALAEKSDMDLKVTL